jgi:hypothetical protein
MLIDCDACAVRGPACTDCVVTVLLAMPTRAAGPRPVTDAGPPAGAELDQAERAAIAVLAGSGLVPPLRLVSRPPAGPAGTSPPGGAVGPAATGAATGTG